MLKIAGQVRKDVDQPVQAPKNNFEMDLEKIISENLQKDLLPSDLAAYFNVSLRQLQRQFREEADTTPTDLIRKIKLEKAAQLLMTSSKNIAEIAYELGFSDPTYFSRLFKKHFGQTPSKFQDNARAT